MATTKDKILKQVEFYFSDSNFPKDKFLRALAAQNEEGYVPIATLASFARMKEISTDVKEITNVIKTSSVLEVNEDSTLVKRKKALPEKDDSIERTVFTKGWAEGYTIETVEKEFSKFGKVLSVRINKQKDKKPKSSAFVEFSTADEAKAAAEKPVKVGDVELIVKPKSQYFQEKKNERESKKNKRKVEDSTNPDNENKKESKKESRETEHPTGVLLSFKNIGTGITREILKQMFGVFGEIAFVDFSKDETEGVIRFSTPEVAKSAYETSVQKKTEIGGKLPEYAILTGEQEQQYWVKVKDIQLQKKDRSKSKRGGKRRTL